MEDRKKRNSYRLWKLEWDRRRRFSYAFGITLGPDENLYIADKNNHRVQVLDKNGTFIKKFGEQGSAYGQLSSPHDLIFLPDGRLIVGDSYYLNYFDSNGTFITRTNATEARQYVPVLPMGRFGL